MIVGSTCCRTSSGDVFFSSRSIFCSRISGTFGEREREREGGREGVVLVDLVDG